MIITGDNNDNVLTGTGEGDALSGRGGNDELRGGRGPDELDGGIGADLLIGGTGDDTYWVQDVGDRVRERLDEGFADLVYSLAPTFRLSANVENLILRGTADIGGFGSGGDDRIVGNAGANRIGGGLGADRLEGRDGDDLYIADIDDTMIEAVGGGIDTVRIEIGAANYRMQANIENALLVGSSDFQFQGNELDNLVRGSEGNNRIVGLLGNDRLNGLGGDDFLEGSEGDDVLNGGAGNDYMVGRTGADTFMFFGDVTSEIISDFSRTDGDRINLRAIDADTGLAGDQQFRFIGTQAFTSAAGELRYFESGVSNYVVGDVDGDGGADFSIRINRLAFERHDFVL